MDLDWDLLTEPKEPKPSWDGVYDEEEELEKWSEHLAEKEYEYHARSAEDKRTEGFWGTLDNWVRHRSVGAGIMLYLDGGEWLGENDDE